MTAKEKAEEYVREKCPELAFTAVCRVSDKHPTGVRKSWRKPQLQHWLRVLAEITDSFLEFEDHGTTFSVWLNYGDDNYSRTLTLSYTTGQPATEADYQAFLDIVGV